MAIYLDDQQFGDLIAACQQRMNETMETTIREKTGVTTLGPCPHAADFMRETIAALLARNDIWPDYCRETDAHQASRSLRA